MHVYLNEVLARIRFASRLASAGPGRCCSSPQIMTLVVTVQSLRASEIWSLLALPPGSGRCACMAGGGS
jgi:hypothetical protein